MGCSNIACKGINSLITSHIRIIIRKSFIITNPTPIPQGREKVGKGEKRQQTKEEVGTVKMQEKMEERSLRMAERMRKNAKLRRQMVQDLEMMM